MLVGLGADALKQRVAVVVAPVATLSLIEFLVIALRLALPGGNNSSGKIDRAPRKFPRSSFFFDDVF